MEQEPKTIRQRGEDRWGSPPRIPRLRDRLFAPLDLSAALLALSFWAASLTPTLLPRTAFIHGALTGGLTIIGYGLSGILMRLFRLQRSKTGFYSPPANWRRGGRIVLMTLTALLVLAGTPLWLRWQNAQRHMDTMPELGSRSMINMVLVAVVVGLIFLAVGRLVTSACGAGLRHLWAFGGPVGARIAVGLLALVVGLVGFDQVIVKGLYSSVYSSYEQGDQTTDPGVLQPTSSLESGGPGSLTPWSTLGLQGRNFAGTATTIANLQRFAGAGTSVMQPIRVYAGLQSAPSPSQRAQLVVKELERTGAFSRSVLMVATATGTGWIDPYASSALEYMTHGNCAIVSMQYSFLPSWIAFLTERGSAKEAGQALIAAVTAHWKTLPASTRPRLVIFGESLGSYGAEAGLAASSLPGSLASINAHGQAAFFVGPTDGNPIWRQVRAARLSPSPVWRPSLPAQNGVEVSNSAQEIPKTLSAARGNIQYVVHGNDPVGWFSWSGLYSPPAWITGHTPPNVPSQVIWFPVVTFLQTAADLMAGFSAPVGYGHNYNDAFAQGMASVAAPEGWTTADTDHLIVVLDHLNEINQSTSSS